jgi:hypothetical protein
MLVASLLLTVAMIGIAYGLLRTSGGYSVVMIVCGLGILAGWPCLMFPAHGLASLLCLAVAIICALRKTAPVRFLVASLAVTVVGYAFVTSMVLWSVVEDNRLRAEFPVESMATRLSYEDKAAARQDGSVAGFHSPAVGTQTALQLAGGDFAHLEERVQWGEPRRGGGPYWYMRESALRRLHDNSVSDFINSPGFGVSRGIGPGRKYVVFPEAAPVLQPPAEYEPPERPSRDGEADVVTNRRGADKALRPQLQDLHENGLVDFVNAPGFGYIRDRDHVAGFQPHQFHEIPTYQSKEKAGTRWRVQRLELVSLLKFDVPAVYLSEHLPRMDELAVAKTRPLDDFEKRGLHALQQGADLEFDCNPTRVRMLGSLRCLQQCAKCHHANRGDLLGAFSYVLKPMAESEEPPSAAVPVK